MHRLQGIIFFRAREITSSLSTAVRPSSKHLKTVEAYSRKVNALTSRAENYLVTEEKKLSKEMRRRSLNFHFFTTLKRQSMEVGHMEARQLNEIRKNNNLNLKEILSLLSSHNKWEPDSLTRTDGILRTIASNFDSIEPSVYARILDLMECDGDDNTINNQLLEKMVDKSVKSRQARKYFSEHLTDMVQVAKYLQGNTSVRNKVQSRGFHQLVQEILLEASSGHESVNVTGAIVEYLTIPHTASKERSTLFRRLRQRLTQHMQDSMTDSKSNRLMFFLFEEESNKLDPKSVLDMVYQYLGSLHGTRLKSERFRFSSFLTTLNHFLQLKSLPALNKIQIISQLHRVGLKPPPCGLQLVHEWLGRNQNLSDCNETDLQLVSTCSRVCRYSHTFRLGRLNHALRLKGSKPADQPGALKVVLRIPRRMYRHRSIRKYMHRVLSKVKVERLPKTVIEEINDVHCGKSFCQHCSQFMKRLALAKAFHLVTS